MLGCWIKYIFPDTLTCPNSSIPTKVLLLGSILANSLGGHYMNHHSSLHEPRGAQEFRKGQPKQNKKLPAILCSLRCLAWLKNMAGNFTINAFSFPIKTKHTILRSPMWDYGSAQLWQEYFRCHRQRQHDTKTSLGQHYSSNSCDYTMRVSS